MGCGGSKPADDEVEFNVEEQELTSLPSIPPKTTKLNCASNKLTALPPDLGSMTALKEIDASTNTLTTIPAELAGCEALEVRAAGLLHHSALLTLGPSCSV